MLNSKYAPVALLAFLAILVIGAIGWFAGISPTLSKTATLADQTQLVKSNTDTVNLATAQLKQYAEALTEAEPLDPFMELHLPQSLAVSQLRTRVTDAASSAQVRIIAMSLEPSQGVEGWDVPSSVRRSTQVAQLFQTGPTNLATPGTETAAYVPAVSPPAPTSIVVSGLVAVPVSMRVGGSVEQLTAFVSALTDPNKQLFQIYSHSVTARRDGDTEVGLAEAGPNDALLEISGYFYLLDPDSTLIDDGEFVNEVPAHNDAMTYPDPAAAP